MLHGKETSAKPILNKAYRGVSNRKFVTLKNDLTHFVNPLLDFSGFNIGKYPTLALCAHSFQEVVGS
jgi:hypothetical protein